MSTNGMLDKQQVIDALTIIRMEWDEAADSEVLEAVYGSVGLILQDVVRGIGLSADECLSILGQPVTD